MCFMRVAVHSCAPCELSYMCIFFRYILDFLISSQTLEALWYIVWSLINDFRKNKCSAQRNETKLLFCLMFDILYSRFCCNCLATCYSFIGDFSFTNILYIPQPLSCDCHVLEIMRTITDVAKKGIQSGAM